MTPFARYHVVVVDDITEHASELVRMLESSASSTRLDVTAMSPNDLYQAMSSNRQMETGPQDALGPTNPFHIDILFADIVFDGSTETGIDYVRRFFPEGCGTQVVYVTGYNDFHTQVYQTDHVCFLTKPYTPDDLEQALQLAFKRLEHQALQPIVLKFGSDLYTVNPKDIRYIESELRVAHVHTATQIIQTYATLSDLAAKLPSTFIQCHKSFLVNSAFIQKATSTDIILTDGTVIPVSRRRRKQTHDDLMRLIRAV